MSKLDFEFWAIMGPALAAMLGFIVWAFFMSMKADKEYRQHLCWLCKKYRESRAKRNPDHGPGRFWTMRPNMTIVCDHMIGMEVSNRLRNLKMGDTFYLGPRCHVEYQNPPSENSVEALARMVS